MKVANTLFFAPFFFISCATPSGQQWDKVFTDNESAFEQVKLIYQRIDCPTANSAAEPAGAAATALSPAEKQKDGVLAPNDGVSLAEFSQWQCCQEPTEACKLCDARLQQVKQIYLIKCQAQTARCGQHWSTQSCCIADSFGCALCNLKATVSKNALLKQCSKAVEI